MPPPKKKIDRDRETPDQKYKRKASHRGLRGLANDTKWAEFIKGMTALVKLMVPIEVPAFRYMTLDGEVTRWDRDYPWHLPPGAAHVIWFDIEYRVDVSDNRLPPKVRIADHGDDMIALIRRIGLEFDVGKKHIRIFGYAPKNMELFDA